MGHKDVNFNSDRRPSSKFSTEGPKGPPSLSLSLYICLFCFVLFAIGIQSKADQVWDPSKRPTRLVLLFSSMGSQRLWVPRNSSTIKPSWYWYQWVQSYKPFQNFDQPLIAENFDTILKNFVFFLGKNKLKSVALKFKMW